MAWQQLNIDTDPERAEALEEALFACGAVSVTLADRADNPILEPGVGETPLWPSVRLTALFDEGTDPAIVGRELEGLADTGNDSWQWETLEDQPWERAWMADFQPRRCGERLWICPSWQSPPEPEAVNLILDPGLAFGSGTHPTTFLCLQWLDGLDLTGTTVVDYGCGSGILGIAALLLGADHVIAVDNDPQALSATRENLTRNGLEASRLSTHSPEETPAVEVDIMLANILAAPLIDLADTLVSLTRRGGQLCLSGIVEEQTETVMAAYPSVNFDAPALSENWARLTGTRLV